MNLHLGDRVLVLLGGINIPLRLNSRTQTIVLCSAPVVTEINGYVDSSCLHLLNSIEHTAQRLSLSRERDVQSAKSARNECLNK